MKHRYMTPMRWNWFMGRSGFRYFMIREVTSVFIAVYLVYLLLWLHRLSSEPEAFASMMEAARTPGWWVFHTIVFMAAMFHSITWFNLTPKINPVIIGEERVPDSLVAIGMGYAPWIVVSAVVVWGVIAYV